MIETSISFNQSAKEGFYRAFTNGYFLVGPIKFAYVNFQLPRTVLFADSVSHNVNEFLQGAEFNATTVLNIESDPYITSGFEQAASVVSQYANISITKAVDPADAYLYVAKVELIQSASDPTKGALAVGGYPFTTNNGSMVIYANSDKFDVVQASDAGSMVEYDSLHELFHTLGLYHPHDTVGGGPLA